MLPSAGKPGVWRAGSGEDASSFIDFYAFSPPLGKIKNEVVAQTRNRPSWSPAGGLTPFAVLLDCHQAAGVVIAAT